MRYLLALLALPLFACSSGGDDTYHLADGDYTKAELTETWDRLIEAVPSACPAIRTMDTDQEVMDYLNSLGEDDDPNIQENDPKDVGRAIELLRDRCN